MLERSPRLRDAFLERTRAAARVVRGAEQLWRWMENRAEAKSGDGREPHP